MAVLGLYWFFVLKYAKSLSWYQICFIDIRSFFCGVCFAFDVHWSSCTKYGTRIGFLAALGGSDGFGWLALSYLLNLPCRRVQVICRGRVCKKLTREADAGLVWRGFALLSVVISILIAANLSGQIAIRAYVHFGSVLQQSGIPIFGMAAGLMVIALILSLLKSRLLMVGVLLILLGSLLSLYDSVVSVPVMTEVGLLEWSRAVILALCALVLVQAYTGLGGYGDRTKFDDCKKIFGRLYFACLAHSANLWFNCHLSRLSFGRRGVICRYQPRHVIGCGIFIILCVHTA